MPAFHELMKASQPGTMVQHLYSMDGGSEWLAGLAIREDAATLAALPRRAAIHTRGAVIQVDAVHLILLMLHLNHTLLYETFVSLQHDDSPEFVTRMARQTRLSILLFDGHAPQPVRAFTTANGFQTLFQQIVQTSPRWPGWAFADFDQAKAALYARYPTVLDLWQALGRRTGAAAWPASLYEN